MPRTVHCAFCGRPREEVRAMVLAPRANLAQPIVAICTDCVTEAAYTMAAALNAGSGLAEMPGDCEKAH